MSANVVETKVARKVTVVSWYLIRLIASRMSV